MPSMQIMADNKIIQITILLILAVFVALPYSNTLHSPFTFDDAPNITKNRHLQLADLSLASFSKAATKSMNKRRWLPNISFALNNYYSGNDVFSYHFVNIALHIITALFFYGLLACTLSLTWSGLSVIRAREISFWAALLWGVHPVNTNAVTYIVQRMTIMATLFYIASLFFYLHGRTRSGPLITRFFWYLACLVTALSAFASKENAFMLPFAIVGFELYFLSQYRDKKKLGIAIAAIGALFFIAVSAWIIFGENIVEAILGGYKARDFTLSERLLTECRVAFHYLSLLAIPFPHRLNLVYDYTLSTGLFSPPQTFIAIVGLLSLAFVSVHLFKKHRLWSFALFWFFLNLIIESTVIPLEIIFEHRLYLPSMYIFVAFIFTFSGITAHRTKLFRGIVLTLAILLTISTWQRNEVWSSEITLWEDIAKKSPQLARGHLNVGIAHSNAGDYQESIKHYLKAISLNPE